jgi:hypothetical protein
MASKTLLQLLLEAGIKRSDAEDLIKRSGVEGEGIMATNVGKLITRSEQGNLVLFTSRLDDPTIHKPYNAYAIGSDQRYVKLTSEYNLIDKAIRQHLKVLNDDKKLLSPEQMKTLKYNIVVRNRTKNEIDRLNKVLTDEGVNTVDLLKRAGIATEGRATGARDPSVTEYIQQNVKKRPRDLGDLPPETSLTLGKQTAKRQVGESEQELQGIIDQAMGKVKTKIDDLGKVSENGFDARKAQNEKYKINMAHKNAGRSYDKQFTPGGREGEFNAVTRELLPVLHDRGIIKLDDEVLKSLKDAEWVRGLKGEEFDPKKIFRYHFGDRGFNVLNVAIDETPNAQSASDIVKFMSDRNLFGQFTVKKANSPKNKFDHMTLTELQGVADEARGVALLIKDGESAFYKTPDEIAKASEEKFGIMNQYLAKIRERKTRARRDQLAKIKKFPALDPNDANFVIDGLDEEGLAPLRRSRFQYSVENDPSGTTQFRTKYDTWDDVTGSLREKPKLVEKQNMTTGEIVVKDIDYQTPPVKDARMSLDIAIQMGDDVFDFSTEALAKKGYNLGEIDTIQKGRKVFKMLEEKKKVRLTQAEVDTPHPVFDINTGEVDYVSGGSRDSVDLYYTGRSIIEKLEELKDLGVDDIDRISLDDFDPERYGFSKGGIANKDMVRFLFDDNVRN